MPQGRRLKRNALGSICARNAAENWIRDGSAISADTMQCPMSNPKDARLLIATAVISSALSPLGILVTTKMFTDAGGRGDSARRHPRLPCTQVPGLRVPVRLQRRLPFMRKRCIVARGCVARSSAEQTDGRARGNADADLEGRMKHIISLGAGVQSSTMALMAAHGEIIPMPDAAIFADTQAEPNSVYIWLDWLEKQLPFPVYRVTSGSLKDKSLKLRTVNLPVFTKDAEGNQGKVRNRNCTRDFKLVPLKRKEREIAGIKRGQKEVGVILWIGISNDEIYRMKPSREPWCSHRFPLIDKSITRQGCVEWMRNRGYPEPPRSACVFCPFHNDTEWTRLMVKEPEAFAEAVEFEKSLQTHIKAAGSFRTTPFFHRSLVPLDQVVFQPNSSNGQLNIFNNECEGMCGV